MDCIHFFLHLKTKHRVCFFLDFDVMSFSLPFELIALIMNKVLENETKLQKIKRLQQAALTALHINYNPFLLCYTYKQVFGRPRIFNIILYYGNLQKITWNTFFE